MLNIRFMFGLALTMCVHGDWLLTRQNRPTRAEMLDEITAFTLSGLGAKPTELRRPKR